MNWYIIPGFPDYHINDEGEVSNADGVMLSANYGYYLLMHQGRRTSVKKSALQQLDLSSCEEAPNLITSQRKTYNKEYAARQRAELKNDISKYGVPNRRCTDCGKPTANYRCEKCWRKKRGFGAEEAAENPEIADKEAAFQAVKAAKDRKAKTPSAPDWAEPWKPFAWRPHIEDRQAEFLAKGEGRIMKESRISEEVTISPTATASITMSELAALTGVGTHSLYRIRRGLDQTGRNAQIVSEKLCELGLTWENVKKIPHDERRQRNASQKAAETHKLEKTMTEVAGAMEPETGPLLPEPKDIDLEKFNGDVNKLIAALNDKLQKIKVTPADQGMTLERVLNDLKRLLPYGAKVRIEF